MHIKRILNNFFSTVTSKKRLATLIQLVEGVFICKHLTLTNLGRALNLPIQERSMVRKVDRFLGNTHLLKEQNAMYKQICSRLIGTTKCIYILVDWSQLPNSKQYLLRASLAFSGRSLPIYQSVYEEKQYGTQGAQNEFLDNLKQVLPKTCAPIIITDAGFHNPWFAKVQKLGWDFVGRVRGRKTFCLKGETHFKKLTSLFSKITHNPKLIGEITLCQTNSLNTALYGYKGKPKHRKAHRKTGKNGANKLCRDKARAAKEPWLLVTSLSRKHNMAKKVINLYRLRMQIEEDFRDVKSTKFGFGFEHVRTQGVLRLSNFIFLTTIAALYAYLIGGIAEKNGWHRRYQVSSTRKKRVLSLFFLGCRVIKREIKLITYQMLNCFLDEVSLYAKI